MDRLGNAHAPEDDGALGAGVEPRHPAQGVGVDAADLGHHLGRELRQVFAERLEAFRMGLDILAVVKLLGDDDVHHGVEQGDVGAGGELQHMGGMLDQRMAARVADDEGGAALGGIFEEGSGNRVVLGRVGADDQDDIGLERVGERRGDRRRTDGLEQSRHRRGMAQPGAVVDIVGAETGAHQLLEEIGLLVAALGRTEAGQGLAAVTVADGFQSGGGESQGLVPARLAEMAPGIGRIDVGQRVLGRIVAANQGLGQAVRVADVIEPEAALDAESALVAGTLTAVDGNDFIVLDVIGDLTAHPAVGTDAVDPGVGIDDAHPAIVQQGRLHQGACRTDLDAFATGDAGRVRHGIVEIEYYFGPVTAIGHADNVVDLGLAAGPDAEIAVDTGVEIDRHGRVAGVRDRDCRLLARREAAGELAHLLGPGPQLGARIVAALLGRLVGDQKLHDHLACSLGAVAVGDHHHIRRRCAQA